jgi:hypothetical protein
MHTLLRDILAAMLTRAKESTAERNDPANARLHRLAGQAAAHRVSELQAQAADAFGNINGWRTDTSYNFTPDRLGRPNNNYNSGSGCRGWRDHALYYRAPRRDGKRGWANVAIVGQPYGIAKGVREEMRALVEQGYALHVPPAGAHASIWYPSATLFLVLTSPGITMNWLPEQQTAVPDLTPRPETTVDVETLLSKVPHTRCNKINGLGGGVTHCEALT